MKPVLIAALSFFLPHWPCAQEPAAASDAKSADAKALDAKTKLLGEALAATAKQTALAFTTKDKGAPFGRAQGMPQSEPVTIHGSWSDGLLHATTDDHEIVRHGGRMVAREGKGEWKLRSECLSNGAPLPFVLRPDLFCAALLAAAPKVVHAEVGTFEDMPVETLTVTLADKEAYELLYAGALPRPSNPFQGIVMRFGMAGAAAPAEPELTLDIAFVIDPPTKIIRAVKARSYTKGQGGGVAFNVVAVGGAGGGRVIQQQQGGDDDEEETKAEAKAKELTWKDGLPVRKTKNLSVSSFDVTFAKPDAKAAPQLDATAKKLLGID